MSQIHTVECLRGLAALSVGYFHFTRGNEMLPMPGILRESGSFGWLGVEAFFVISGFVIPLSMSVRRFDIRHDLPGFIGKRLTRLEPPYILTVILCLILWYVSSIVPGYRGEPPSVSVKQLLLHIGYLNAFFDESWLNPVFWTLAIEFQFYFSICLIYPLVSSNKLTVGVMTITLLLLLSHTLDNSHLLLHWLGLFACGIATWMYHAKLINALTLISLLALSFTSNYFVLGLSASSVGVGTALIIAFVTIPRHRILVFLGAISYSFYLLHVPIGGRVINLMTRLEPSGIRDVSAVASALVISIIAAYLMYRFVEKPSKALAAKIQYGKTLSRNEKPGEINSQTPV